MKNVIGSNIARFRREKKMTQEALADHLHVSFQAVSKWETARPSRIYPPWRKLPPL